MNIKTYGFTFSVSGAILLFDLIYCLTQINKTGDIWMDKSSLIVAIIGLVGVALSILAAIIRDVLNSKKQSGAILDSTASIKTDTVSVVPKVDNIDNNTQKVRDIVTERMLPSLIISEQNNKSMLSKIDELYGDMKYHKELRKELIDNGKSKDYFIEGISALYQKNEILSAENRELRQALEEQKEDNALKAVKIEKLDKEIHELKSKLEKDKFRDMEMDIDI